MKIYENHEINNSLKIESSCKYYIEILKPSQWFAVSEKFFEAFVALTSAIRKCYQKIMKIDKINSNIPAISCPLSQITDCHQQCTTCKQCVRAHSAWSHEARSNVLSSAALKSSSKKQSFVGLMILRRSRFIVRIGKLPAPVASRPVFVPYIL